MFAEVGMEQTGEEGRRAEREPGGFLDVAANVFDQCCRPCLGGTFTASCTRGFGAGGGRKRAGSLTDLSDPDGSSRSSRLLAH